MNGYKGNIRQLTGQLNAVRAGEAPLREGGKKQKRNLSLSEFIAITRPGQEIGHLYADLQIDPHHMTVDELMSDSDAQYLYPEIVLDGVKRGMGLSSAGAKQWKAFQAALMAASAALANPVTSTGNATPYDRFLQPETFLAVLNNARFKKAFYQNLLAITETGLTGPMVNVPYLNGSAARTREITEGETKPKGSVSGSTKSFRLKKFSTGLGVTYEMVRRFSINMSALFFADAGRLHATKKNNAAVDCILNGDQDDLSFTAAVIGVDNTTNGFQWIDHTRVLTWLEDIDISPDAMVASKQMAHKILNIKEFKENQNAGSKLANINIQTPLPTEFSLYTSKKVTATKVAYVDSSINIGEAIESPMMIQSEKIIARDLIDTYVDEWSGFWKLLRVASVVVDESIAYSGNQFPSWMEPVED